MSKRRKIENTINLADIKHEEKFKLITSAIVGSSVYITMLTQIPVSQFNMENIVSLITLNSSLFFQADSVSSNMGFIRKIKGLEKTKDYFDSDTENKVCAEYAQERKSQAIINGILAGINASVFVALFNNPNNSEVYHNLCGIMGLFKAIECFYDLHIQKKAKETYIANKAKLKKIKKR